MQVLSRRLAIPLALALLLSSFVFLLVTSLAYSEDSNVFSLDGQLTQVDENTIGITVSMLNMPGKSFTVSNVYLDYNDTAFEYKDAVWDEDFPKDYISALVPMATTVRATFRPTDLMAGDFKIITFYLTIKDTPPPQTYTFTIRCTMSGGAPAAITIDYPIENPDFKLIEEIIFDPATVDYIIDERELATNPLVLSPTILPEDASLQELQWTSSNTGYATVANGLLTASRKGTVTITATSKDGTNISAQCKVNISVLTSPTSVVFVDKSTKLLVINETIDLSAIVYPAETRESDKGISWSSSDENIATVDANGRVTAKGVGTAQITVTSDANSSLTASCDVIVLAEKGEKAAQIGETQYDTLVEAIAALEEGDVLKLLATQKLTDPIVISKSCAIDFNGFTLIAPSLEINAGVTIPYIQNGTINFSSTFYGLYVRGTIETLSNCTITNNGYIAITLSGGTIESIKDCYIQSINHVAIITGGGLVKSISDSTVIGKSNAVSASGSNGVVIHSGTFIGGTAVSLAASGNSSIKAYGGLYSNSLHSSYLADGYKVIGPNADGYYEVVEDEEFEDVSSLPTAPVEDKEGSVQLGQVIRSGGTYTIDPLSINGTIYIYTTEPVTLVGDSAITFNNVGIRSARSEVNLTIKDLKISMDGYRNIIHFRGAGNQLYFSGTNILDNSGFSYAAIHVNKSAELAIDGDGELYLYKYSQGAGIGGDTTEINGTITINGGTIFGKGSKQGAFIGGGSNTSNLTGVTPGDITINGGTLNLIGVARGAIIGGSAGGTASSGGDFYINGGTITFNIDYTGAAIGGGGYDKGNGSDGGTMHYQAGSLRTYMDWNAVIGDMGTPGIQWPGVLEYGVNDAAITADKINSAGNPVYLLTFNTDLLSAGADSFIIKDETQSVIYEGGLHSYHYINEALHKSEQIAITTTPSNWEPLDDANLYVYLEGKDQLISVNGEEFAITWNPETSSLSAAGDFIEVSFDTKGGSEVKSQYINIGDKVSCPTELTKEGYSFVGWYTDEDLTLAYDFDTVIESDTKSFILYAKWQPLGGDGAIIVNFNTKGGSAVASQAIEAGGQVSLPAAPTKEGYSFAGWYTDEDLTSAYDFNSVIEPGTDSFTLYAKWQTAGEYKITYELAGGVNDSGNPDSYQTADTPFILKAPTKFGYLFMGWSLTSDYTNPELNMALDQGSAGDKKFYAVWANADVSVTLDYNDDERSDTTLSAPFDSLLQLASPSRKGVDPVDEQPGTGYTFLGWELNGKLYTDSILLDQSVVGSDLSITLQAQWESFEIAPDAFTITLADTSNGNPIASPGMAEANTLVTIIPNADSDYGVQTIQILDSDGEVLDIPVSAKQNGEYEFIMPGQNILVAVRYERSHTIAVKENIANGSVKLSKEQSVRGRIVQITPLAHDGYFLSVLSATYGNGGNAHLIELSANTIDDLADGSYYLTMPGGDIEVNAGFKALGVELVKEATAIDGKLSLAEAAQLDEMLNSFVLAKDIVNSESIKKAVNKNLLDLIYKELGNTTGQITVDDISQEPNTARIVSATNAIEELAIKITVRVIAAKSDLSGENPVLALEVSPQLVYTSVTKNADGDVKGSPRTQQLDLADYLDGATAIELTLPVPAQLVSNPASPQELQITHIFSDGSGSEVLTALPNLETDGNYSVQLRVTKFSEFIISSQAGEEVFLNADTSNNAPGQVIEITFNDNAKWRNSISDVMVDGRSIAGQYTITSGALILSDTVFSAIGSYEIVVKASGYADLRVSQEILSPCYSVVPEPDSVYAISENEYGIKMMTVNPGLNGLKYFSVQINPERSHNGNETLVFTHTSGGVQHSLNAIKADFDLIHQGNAGFNIAGGDVVKVYVVDQLTNDLNFNPVIFQ